MANPDHVDRLMARKAIWNEWRFRNPDILPDLNGADLNRADLYERDLRRANLCRADLHAADLRHANLSEANLRLARLRHANLRHANLNSADLTESDMYNANLYQATLRNAKITKANLMATDLAKTDLGEADLGGANLALCRLIETNLAGADLTGCCIYGTAAWKVNLENTVQSNLVVSSLNESTITVDNLEVAQFVYLLLNNERIRDVINTIGQKAVLILGRFTPERKSILDSIAEALRQRGYLPIIFDFAKSQERDFTETIKVLAGLSLFVIADMTNPKSNPLELQATIPDYMIPFVPIIQEGEKPFSMFVDLQRKYNWVLSVRVYDTEENLLATLDEAIIRPAIDKHNELVLRRAGELEIMHVKEFLPKRSV